MGLGARAYLRAAFSAAVVIGTLLLALTAALAAAAQKRCRNASLRPNANDVEAVQRATVCVVNLERAHSHLRALRENRALARIARRQSADMVRGNYFADHSLAGRTPLERIVPAFLPARVLTSAQNIGWGNGNAATPVGIVRAWMESPPHRRIILGRAFTEAGAGVVPALPAMLELGGGGATYTLDASAFVAAARTRATSSHARGARRRLRAAMHGGTPRASTSTTIEIARESGAR